MKPQIYSLYPEKSPVSDVARFYLRHDRPDMLMTIKLSIFDWSGREVWSTEQTAMSTMWVSSPIEWNLTDKAGRRVRDGIYLYRAIISVNGKLKKSSLRHNKHRERKVITILIYLNGI